MRFGTCGPGRGPTSSFAKLDNYWGHVGRLHKRVIGAYGQLASEEIYWRKHMDRRYGCRPYPTKMAGHYHTFRRAKINGVIAYIFWQWKKMSDHKKKPYIQQARGKPVTGINLFVKEFMLSWGFGKGGFGTKKFGSFHYPLAFFGFTTVAFGMGAFGSYYPQPRRLGFGLQTFGEMRFGSNLRRDRQLMKFR